MSFKNSPHARAPFGRASAGGGVAGRRKGGGTARTTMCGATRIMFKQPTGPGGLMNGFDLYELSYLTCPNSTRAMEATTLRLQAGRMRRCPALSPPSGRGLSQSPKHSPTPRRSWLPANPGARPSVLVPVPLHTPPLRAGAGGGRTPGPTMPRNVYPAAPPRRQAAMPHDAAGAAEVPPPPRGPAWRPSLMSRPVPQRPPAAARRPALRPRSHIRPAAAPRPHPTPAPSPPPAAPSGGPRR